MHDAVTANFGTNLFRVIQNVTVKIGVLTGVILLVAACTPGISSGPAATLPTPIISPAPPSSGETISGVPGVLDIDFAQELIFYTNQARAAESLPPLAESECATSAAAERVIDLIGAAELAHAPLISIHLACDLGEGFSGENLIRGAATPADLVNAWMQSPSHRQNLLNPSFTELGIACVNDPDPAPAPDSTKPSEPSGEPMLCSQIFLGRNN